MLQTVCHEEALIVSWRSRRAKEPMFLELLLGKRVNKDIPADHPLIWDDFIDS